MIVITLLGVVTMAIPPVATGLSVRLAASAPTLAAGFTVSAFNGGIAIGSLIGAQTLNTSLGETGPATVGVAMVVLGLVPLIALAANRGSRAEPATTNHSNLCAAHVVRA